MRRAVLYARTSGDDRGKNNLGSQLADCRAYAESQNCVIVREITEDERGASGYEMNLPGVSEALDMAERKEYDVLVARDTERFSRSAGKALVLEDMLKERGIRVEYVLEDFDDTDMGKLMKTIRAGIAEFDWARTVFKMWRGRRWRCQQGRIMVHGNYAPYGFRAKEKRDKMGNITAKWLIIDDEEAGVVRKIYRLFVVGGLDISAIADELKGIPTWSDKHGSPFRREAGYGEWSKSTVYKILKSETYAGLWHYGKRKTGGALNPRDTWIAVDVPEIVDRKTWELAQKRLAENKEKSKRRTKWEYLMRGRVVCGNCYTPMIGRAEKKGKYLYYYCPRGIGKHKNKECSNNRYWPVKKLDDEAWNYVSETLYSPEVFREEIRRRVERARDENKRAFDEIKSVDKLLAENQRQLGQILDLYLQDEFPKDVLLDKRKRLESVIESLSGRKTELESTLDVPDDSTIEILMERAEDWAELLRVSEDLDFETRRKYVEAFDCKAILRLDEAGAGWADIGFSLSPTANTNTSIDICKTGITFWNIVSMSQPKQEHARGELPYTDTTIAHRVSA